MVKLNGLLICVSKEEVRMVIEGKRPLNTPYEFIL